MPQIISSVTCLLLALCLFPSIAAASDRDLWWPQAEATARDNGYALIDTPALASLMQMDENVLILDVRADYEFAAGHIPGAANLEFDLGDQAVLDSDKRRAFEQAAGPDRTRPLVIYCRGFR